MYETEEVYSKNGRDMKDILKSCILNYYISNKDMILYSRELQFDKSHYIINITSNKKILSNKGDNHVQTTV